MRPSQTAQSEDGENSCIQHLAKEPKRAERAERTAEATKSLGPVSFSWLIMSKVAINSKTFPRCVLKRAKTASKQYENETEEEAARRQDPAVFGCCKTRFSEAHCAIDLILGRLSRFEPFDLTVLSKRERERETAIDGAKESDREFSERSSRIVFMRNAGVWISL